MLRKIQIKNFKSVQDIEIELGRVNVFIGENGCGKTSILEGLSIASAALSGKLDQEFLKSRGIRVADPRLMKSAFNAEENENGIYLSVTNDEENVLEYTVDYKGKNLIVKKFSTDIVAKLAHSTFLDFMDYLKNDKKLLSELQSTKEKSKKNKTKNTIKETDSNQLVDKFTSLFKKHYMNSEDEALRSNFLNVHSPQFEEKFKLSNFLIYTPEESFLRRFEEEGQISPIGIKGEGLFSHLVDNFKENNGFETELSTYLNLINWFDGIEIPKDLAFTEMRLNIKDRFLKDTVEYFDQRSANEGFLYLLFYFTLFLSKETPHCFAIDNVDNALNPKLCRELIERIVPLSKDKHKQVILTTHNPAILDGLDLDDDEQRLFVIYRNADGHTKIRRIKSPKPIPGIETVRLSEAFIRGYIGGLPKNF